MAGETEVLSIGGGEDIQLRPGGTPKPTETPAATPPVETPAATTPTETPAGETPATTNTPPVEGETPPAEGTTPPVEPKPIPETEIFSHLSTMTGGKVKSKEEFEGILQERDSLAEQAAKGFEPKFTDERAKWAYQLLSASSGDELGTAMRTMRALSFNVEGKSDKDVLFEAFLLDPNNTDLGPKQAADLFEAKFNKEYGEIEETDVLKKRELALDVKQAKEGILKIQKEFKTHEEAPRQVAAQVETGVANAVKEFKGMKIALADNPTDADFLNVAIADPKELQSLQEQILNPDQAYNDLVAKFETEKGFDFQGLRNEMWKRNNVDKLLKLSFNQGKEAGKIAVVNKVRNASEPVTPAAVGTPTPAGKELTLEQAWANAKKAG